MEIIMAIKSVCDACGMTLNEKASFCPTCGGRMNIIEESDTNTADTNVVIGQPEAAPAPENSPMADNPALNAAMNNSAPSAAPNDVPPTENNNVPPIPPVNNVPPVGNNIPPMGNNIPPITPNNTYGYQTPQPETPKTAKDTMALVGMILGIVSLALCCLNLLMLPVAIAGLVLSIIGIKSVKRKGMSIAGIICSALAFLLCIIIFCEGMSEVKKQSNLYSDVYEDIFGDDLDDLDDLLDEYSYNYNYDWD